MEISVLFENSKIHSKYKNGHGLAILIHHEGKKYLFDTGANKKILHNADIMQESLKDLDGIIISHGHSDHTGGLRYLSTEKIPIYGAADTPAPHYLKILQTYLYVGPPKKSLAKLSGNLQIIEKNTPLEPNFYLIPLKKSRHITSNLYKKKDGKFVLDDFSDELMLVIQNETGLTVFTGCSHHGILSMAKQALQLFPNQPINNLIGGFHMIGIPYLNNLGMSKEKIMNIGAQLNDLPIKKIITCHCTGEKAFQLLKQQLGNKLETISAGETRSLDNTF